MKQSSRHLLFVFASSLVAITSFLNCTGFSATVEKLSGAASGRRSSFASSAANGDELISDANFANGFRSIYACLNPDTNPSCATQTYSISNPNSPGATYVPWVLAQWGSVSSMPANGVAQGDNYFFGDNNKSMRLYNDGQVELSINAFNEYGGHYINFDASRKWAHLLFEQVISAPGGAHTDSPSLAAMTELNFAFDFQLLYNDPKKGPGFDAGKHTAQFVMYFTVQNLNSASAGYGQYVWLGIPIFEERTPMPPQNTMLDEGTKSLIYSIAYSDFNIPSTHGGAAVHFGANILPQAKSAVMKAIELGYMRSSNLSDYRIGSMNLGYEVPGLNITTVRFSGLSLRVKTASFVPPSATPVPPVATPAPIPTPIPTPVPAAPAPAKTFQPVGLFSVNGAIYFSNGGDAYCHIANPDEYLLIGGKPDKSNVSAASALPTGQRFDQTCPIAEPVGFFRVNNGDGIYFSNGTDAYCGYSSGEAFFAAGGARDFSNVRNRGSLPSTQRNDGVCQ